MMIETWMSILLLDLKHLIFILYFHNHVIWYSLFGMETEVEVGADLEYSVLPIGSLAVACLASLLGTS